MEILRNDSDNKILINTESNFTPNVDWEDNIQQYEQNILKSIINPTINYETSKFTHESYTGSMGILQDDIWFYFYFYSDVYGTGHTGGLNYEYVGLSLNENKNLTINTSESFFRLEFYKIPSLSGGILDYNNKKLVFTKNLNIPLGEKVYYTPINDFIYVPVFHGSNYKNEENMTFYWFSDDSAISDPSLTGDTLYMTAKYYNSIDGSIYNFTKTGITINDKIIESGNTYYKVTLNRNNNTYYITGSGRYGTSTNPIKFYSNSLSNETYQKYVNNLKVTITLSNIDEILTTSAKAYGEITSVGGGTILGAGVCWALHQNPTINTDYVTVLPLPSPSLGTFDKKLYSLMPGLKHYVRAYVIYQGGVSYSNELTVNTLEYLVSTRDPYGVYSTDGTTMTISGNIPVDTTTINVFEYGFYTGTTSNPTTKVVVGTTPKGFIGIYNKYITGLTPNTQYFYKAYVRIVMSVIDDFIEYGEVKSFTPQIGKPTVTTGYVTIHEDFTNSISYKGNVTSSGGSPITSRGVCYGTTNQPTISNSVVYASGTVGEFDGLFKVSGDPTTYYVRAFATNAYGTSYGLSKKPSNFILQ